VLFSAVADILLAPPPAALFRYALLPAYPLPPRALAFHRLPPIPQGARLPAAVVDRLLDCLAPLAPLPLQWLHVFAEIKLDGERLERVRGLFAFEAAPRQELLLVPTLFPLGGRLTVKAYDGSVDGDVTLFFGGKPPSFTRRFIRSLSSLIFPLTMHQFAADIIPLLTPVFPALVYADTAFYNVRVAPESLPFSLFQFGKLTAEIGSGLLADIKARSVESIWIGEALMTVADAHVRLVVPWATAEMAKETVLRRLMESAVDVDSTIAYAYEVIRAVCEIVAAEQVMVILCTREFVNRPNLGCVFVMLKYFMQKMAAEGKKEIAEYCKIFQDPELGMINGEAKARAFRDLSDPENIAFILREGQ
jgi:hypothetical protein